MLILVLSACSPPEKEQKSSEIKTQSSALVGDGSPIITYATLQEGDTNLLDSGAKLRLTFLANGNGGYVTLANASLKGTDNEDIQLAEVVPNRLTLVQPVNLCSNPRHCVDNQLDLSTLESTLYSLVLTVENSTRQRTVKEYPIRLQGVSEDLDLWKSSFEDLEGIDENAQALLDRAEGKLLVAKAASDTGNLGNVLLACEDAISDLVAATGTTSAISLPQASTTLDHLIERLQGRLNAYKSDQPEQESFVTAQNYIDDARTIHQTAPGTIQELQAGFLTLANAFFWMEEGANPTVVESFEESRDVIRRLLEEMRQYNTTTLPGRSEIQASIDALTPVEALIDRVVNNGDLSLSDQEHVELLLGLTNTAESIKRAENTSAWIRNWQWGLTQITYVYASRALRNAATFIPSNNPVIAEGFSTLESAIDYRDEFRADDFMKLLIDSRCLTLSIYNFVYEPDLEPPRACCEIMDRFHHLDPRFPVPNGEGEACDNVECFNDNECPAENVTDWAACGDFENTCDEDGSQNRTRTTYACEDFYCVSTVTTETQACARDTDGTSCNDGTFCNGDDTCSSGTCSTHEGNPCGANEVCDDNEDGCFECVADTDCDPENVTDWGACTDFDDACDESGTQYRTRTAHACVNFACVATNTQEDQACTRDTDNNACDDGTFCNGADTCAAGTCSVHSNTPCPNGDTPVCSEDNDNCVECLAATDCPETSVTDWGACGGFDDTCDNSGTQTRQRTTYACNGTSCEATVTTETQACTRDTTGTTCDDGNFCNGADTCAAGTCSNNAGDPCGGDETCDESADTCVECLATSDCPNDIVENWTTCGGFDNTCDESGSQTRQRTSYTCVTQSCVPNTFTETQACTRDTDGASCNDGTFCNGSDTCADGACTTHNNDACTHDEICVEATDNCIDCLADSDCPGDQIPSWGTCGGFDNACDESGSQSRTVTSYSCIANSCVASNTPQTQACTRNTDGDSCSDGTFCNGEDTCSGGTCSVNQGSPCVGNQICDEDADECLGCITDSDCSDDTFSSWGTCGGFDNSCDETGTQSRTRTAYACIANTCVGSDSTETQVCARSTDGDSCSDGAFCNGSDTCSGGTCSNHTGDPCGANEVCDETNNQCVSCLADSDCPGDSFTGWGTCGGFDNSCDESGTQNRTRTSYSCVANACVATQTPQTQACARDTDGTSCSDGAFCNGADSCSDGTCSNHTGNPCSGGEVCDETNNQCVSCLTNSDCPGTSYGSWGTCGGYGDTCDESGTRSRSVTTYACVANACVPSTSSQDESCSRDTDGTTCGAGTSYTGWGSCGNYSGTCDESGSQNRTRTNFACSNGTCAGTDTTESRSCSRDTDGDSCGNDSVTSYGSCGGYNNTCDETGTQSRTRTRYTCSSGSCSSSASSESRACSRDTDGDNCSGSTYSAWSSCNYSDTCDNTGTQTRTRTDYDCTNGSCGAARTVTESRSCSRNTNGTSCGGDSYSGWSSCSDYGNSCDESGSQSRTRTTYTCGSGACQASTTTQVQTCYRDTDGNSCASSSYSGWSSCGGYNNVCDNSGSQSRTRTDYTCTNGTCGGSIASESRSCGRNTNGTSCGSTSYGSWGSCGGYSDSCDESGTQSRSITTYSCSSGSCRSSSGSQSQSCSRNTNGNSCGSDSYSSWGSCGGYSNSCDQTGTQSRTRTSYACSSGSCRSSSSSQSQSCSRNTNGASCSDGSYCNGSDRCSNGSCSAHNGDPCGGDICLESSDRCVQCTSNSQCPSTQYGSWSACSGFSNTCDQTGTQSRSVTSYSCSGNSCVSSSSTQTRSCTRSTNGVTCGSTSYGSWGSCRGFSSTCDQTGSRTRTVSPRVCSNGSCSLGSSSTQTQSCNRNTNGNYCENWARCTTGTCGNGSCSADNRSGCFGSRTRCCEPGICIGPNQFCP